MKLLWININRNTYTTRTTVGNLFLNYDRTKSFYCYTLEDTARPEGIKVREETCIPAGIYFVSLFQSERHGKTLILHTEDDEYTIIKGGVKFQACLFHGGNTHKDTAGCVCVARNKVNESTIQGSMKAELRKFIERKMNQGYLIMCEIKNVSNVL